MRSNSGYHKLRAQPSVTEDGRGVLPKIKTSADSQKEFCQAFFVCQQVATKQGHNSSVKKNHGILFIVRDVTFL